MSSPFDRPTTEPGGCACDECGVVFVGVEGHQRCALCHARHEAAIAALQAILKPLGSNLRHYETYARDPAIEAMKAAIGPGWQTIHNAPHDEGRHVLLWLVHPNAAFSKDPIVDGWAAPAVGYWTNHNSGGWVWHGLAGQPVLWRPIGIPVGAA